MNIYISFDMEGIGGIDRFSDEYKAASAYSRAIHAHLQAVIDGIQRSPKNDAVETITIADSHGDGKNLDHLTLSEMDERIELISGYPRGEYMMSGLDRHDVIFFLGYHASSGQHRANMDHSYSTSFHRVSINGIKCSEAMINQIYAKEKHIPVGLIIGDSGLYNQLILEGYMPYVEYVVTKDSLAHSAVVHRNFQKVRAEIMEKVALVLDKDFSALPLGDLTAPYNVTIETNTTLHADMAEMLPGTTRLDGYRIGMSFDSGKDLINGLMSLEVLCRK